VLFLIFVCQDNVLNRNYVLPKRQDFNITSEISASDVALNGKKLAFSSGGTLLVSDVDGKFINAVAKGGA
jgi:hypothetical protein